MKIAISAGHGSKIRGMSDIIDEVDEARRVCNQVCSDLFDAGVEFEGPFFDDVSTSQNENLDRICDWHNAKSRDLDVSVHFNASQHTSKPVGTEVWYVTQEDRAAAMATAIADAGALKDRGPKYTNSLYFLNHTEKPAILLEICFGDSQADCDAYHENFRAICAAIAAQFGAEDIAPSPEPDEDALLQVSGRCSWFGGPNDTGVAPDEGLAFIYKVEDAPQLFLPSQPPGTSGLARRLDPDVFYVACRWDYNVTPKDMLADEDTQALVRAGDKEFLAWPADWGPNQNTGRVADLSPGLMAALGLETDDSVEVIYPAPAQPQPEPEPERATVAIQITASGPVTVTINGTPVGEF
jgi:N-acetylmuramoyl-L-alanine amidase